MLSRSRALLESRTGTGLQPDVLKFPYFVVPAKAGIQCGPRPPRRSKTKSLDSRLRGNNGWVC